MTSLPERDRLLIECELLSHVQILAGLARDLPEAIEAIKRLRADRRKRITLLELTERKVGNGG